MCIVTIETWRTCATPGPDFETPGADVEAQWLATDDPAFQAGKTVNSEWWTLFNDTVPDRLVQTAYEQTLSLQMTGLRIMQARAQPGIAIGRSTRRTRKPPAS